TALSLAGLGLSSLLTGKSESLAALLRKMADVIETASGHYPDWARAYLPASADDLEVAAAGWLRVHARDLQAAGESVGRTLLHIPIGMVIGGLTPLRQARPDRAMRPLAHTLTERLSLLADAFRRVVFAQVRISALNTLLTAIYLAVILPLLGVSLPLTKTMI